MSLFADCTSFTEFLLRNCMQEPEPTSGIFNPHDMKVHFFPQDERTLRADILAELERCHDTARLAVTT